jgi:hypothetical protein
LQSRLRHAARLRQTVAAPSRGAGRLPDGERL